MDGRRLAKVFGGETAQGNGIDGPKVRGSTGMAQQAEAVAQGGRGARHAGALSCSRRWQISGWVDCEEV